MKKTTTPKKSITKGTAVKKSAGKALGSRDRRTPAAPSALLTDLRVPILHPHEELPVELILCQATNTEQVKLLRPDESGIRVAEYITELPSHEMLQAELHQALEIARAYQLPPPEEIQG